MSSSAKQPKILFPVIGIGASAGGLEAITQLLQALPADPGFAFVFIQHLAPQHESILTDLLSKATRLKICEAREGMPLEINCGYVISPATDLVLKNGVLGIRPRKEGRGLHLPIDLFFRSLAEAQGNQAVGVILSGAGSDGVLGLEAICTQGGVAIVQDPTTAKYDSMPRSAMATDCVDFVLTPEGIAKELVRFAQDPYAKNRSLDEIPKDGMLSETEDLGKILDVLRAQKNIDFRCYKRGTIHRRIQRRMFLKNVRHSGDYLEILTKKPEELEALHSDLLIQVTSFFRDPEMFLMLKNKIFPQILKRKTAEDPLRLWVAGCSSGQEVYSMAICLLECLETRAIQVPIQIFGTDISEKAVEKARAGLYPLNIEGDVSMARLQRFFTKSGSTYQINKSIRDLCVFAKQDLLKDPPLSKMDVISCRNVLIYLEPPLQQKVFSIFHFALNPGGQLVVGSAETPGTHSDLFTAAEKKQNIYVKKSGSPKSPLSFAMGPMTTGDNGTRPFLKREMGPATVQQEADRLLLGRYGPAGVILNEHLEVLEYRGDTGPYLQNVPGQASLKLLRMAREGITVGLAEALRKGKEKPFQKTGLRLDVHGQIKMVTIDVIPFKVPLSTQRHWLVMFKPESPEKGFKSLPRQGKKGAKGSLPDRWKEELVSTKAYLQSVLEEKESALEEMQSANEEVVSSNEELQSINEELQTAKEELQATNEELTTVNEQLGRSNQETVSQMNDLNNLVDSTRVAIIMVGPDMRIRRFTPFAEKMLHLIPTDIGRPVSDITPRIAITDLGKRIQSAIASGIIQEETVQDEEKRWYSLRIHPYLTLDKKIDGAVIVLVDVDALKRTEMAVTQARDYAEDVLATIRELFLVLDEDLRVTQANASFYRTFQVLPKDVEGRFLRDLGDGQWNIPNLPERLQRALRENIAIQDFEVEHDFATIGRRTMLLNSSVIVREGRAANMLLLAIEDITEKKQAQEKVNLLKAELEERVQKRTEELFAANKEMETFSYSVAHDLRAPLRGVSGFAQLLLEDYHDKMDARGVDCLQKIFLGSQRMGQLIDDLLSLSSLTREKMRSDKVDLTTLAQGIATELQAAHPARKVQFDIAPGLEAIGDKNLLRIVLVNLLSNAWKFTSKHPGARIEIGVEQTHPDTVFFVRDDGVGFDMAYVNQLFGVFKRLHANEDFPGTGIGLAMVHRIVRLHGGYVWVKGEVDHGATFYFTLAPPTTDKARAPATL